MVFMDFETCGLHGVPVFLQYVEDDDPEIQLWDCWLEEVEATLNLLREKFADQDVCGFNLAFDWFHMQKLHTMWSLALKKLGNVIPVDNIEEFAIIERDARFVDSVIKSRRAMDVMLHARKGAYQKLMARKPVVVKRVPTVIAGQVAKELEKRVHIDGIFFAKKQDKNASRWEIKEVEDHADLRDIVLSFSAAGGLKALAEHALGIKPDVILKFQDVEPPSWPLDMGYAPYAYAISSPEKNWYAKIKTKKGHAWPKHIKGHVSHWGYNTLARKYATDDVKYTRDLWHHFGCPDPGDDDSELACMVGAVRWKGFNVDCEALKGLRLEALKTAADTPTSPKVVMTYLSQVMDEIELSTVDGTAKVILESISEWECDCEGDGCTRCEYTGKHPAAVRAKRVEEARRAKKQVEIYDKLLRAGRFHASFNVIGTLSSRMAGRDGLNPQGINRQKEVRACFRLADSNMVMCGGDFVSFEIVLADAAYNDAALRIALTENKPCQKCDVTGVIKDEEGFDIECDECKGTKEAQYKMHALLALELFPGKTYADIIKSKGTDKDLYNIGKSGVFALIYGGDHNTLVTRQGIDAEIAERAYQNFMRRFPGIQIARKKIFDKFCSMKQPGGIGSKVVWNEPSDYIESLMGFRRYFTLENTICKELFNLAAQNPWKDVKLKVIRRDREQTAGGAVASALYASAFNIQSANMRAAANHVIQSSGATITKAVQRRIWEFQPPGIHPWQVLPLNVHDEILCPCRPELQKAITAAVKTKVEEFRPEVPLIEIDWGEDLKSWAEK